ncbi:uncharacterized protein JCM15063_001986 [Sporobolomyces koalae]|uniref:uncharacterized protein n=1 Tax=Sporobolomyces koalae TaxID=500713 RepID=UPI00317B61DA
MIPHRPHRPLDDSTASTSESVSTRLARLRSEQTPKPRFTHTHTSAATPLAAWLRPHADPALNPNRTRSSTRRTGTAGPPAPPSWTSCSPSLGAAATLNHKSTPTKSRTRLRQLDERRRLAEPLIAERHDQSFRDSAPGKGVDPLFEIAGQVVARDVAAGLGQGQESYLLPELGYLPLYIKVRLLDQVFASWRHLDDPLTNSGARELLRTDLDGFEEEEEEDDHQENDVDQEEWELELDLLSTPTSHISTTSLTNLNLSFSRIDLETLREILVQDCSLRPSTSSSSSTRPKLVPKLPHLSTLILVSMRSIEFSHDSFLTLLSTLTTLRSLSICGNYLRHPKSLRAEPEEEESLCARGLFLSRLSDSTRALRTIDLSYLVDDRIDPHELNRRIEWSSKWLNLSCIGLRRFEPRQDFNHPDEREQQSREKLSKGTERIKREITNQILERRPRHKWIEIIL